MTTLTRQQANTLLAHGVALDVRDAGAVRTLLEQQFEAALRHRSADLSLLAGQLEPLLNEMETRRQQRLSLVRALLGAHATMLDYLGTLAPAPRAALESAWEQLEAIVRECKAATTRNANLLAEQYSVMQRVLHGEDQLYAPR